jgi:hypothetical protein
MIGEAIVFGIATLVLILLCVAGGEEKKEDIKERSWRRD